MRRILTAAVLAVITIVVGGLIVPGASARDDRRGANSVRHVLLTIARQVEAGFSSLEEHVEIAGDFFTRSLGNQTEILATQSKISEDLLVLVGRVGDGPDLVVGPLSIHGNCLFIDGSLVFRVANEGTGPDPAPPSSLLVVAPAGFSETYEVPALSSGDAFDVFIPEPPFCDADSCDDFLAIADFYVEVAEVREDNNRFDRMFSECERIDLVTNP